MHYSRDTSWFIQAIQVSYLLEQESPLALTQVGSPNSVELLAFAVLQDFTLLSHEFDCHPVVATMGGEGSLLIAMTFDGMRLNVPVILCVSTDRRLLQLAMLHVLIPVLGYGAIAARAEQLA